MQPAHDYLRHLTRRTFIGRNARGIGGVALGALLSSDLALALGAPNTVGGAGGKGQPGLPHFAPKAKRVLCLFQSGGLSHVDLFDDKPMLHKHAGLDLPASIKGTQRITGMTSNQSAFPVVPPLMTGKRCGKHGTWISDLLPNIQSIADDICIIKSLHTEAINHDPAITYMNTGNQLPGYASMGAWASYGLGTENQNLPAFIAMISQGTGKNPDQPIFSRLWGSGFLPASHQGVGLRAGANPVLYLNNPPGISRDQQGSDVAAINALNVQQQAMQDDPEIATRIAQYEMAFRMQASVPELMDIRGEGPSTLELYGCQPGDGSFAANCLLARRLAERGVRFIQLYHKDWDHHGGVKEGVALKAQEIDRACMALITDLKQRGMFHDTLIVWAGEFGRTPMSQGGNGRDHHNKAMTVWLAGAGIRGGIVHGATDDLGYAAVEKVCTVHDLHATMMHQLGIEHDSFSVKFQGLDAKLTGVEGAKVLHEILT